MKQEGDENFIGQDCGCNDCRCGGDEVRESADTKSRAWFSELEEKKPEIPDPDKRECCVGIAITGIYKFQLEFHLPPEFGDVHKVFQYEMKICPVCGRDMIEFVKKFREKFKAKMNLPGDIKEPPADNKGDSFDNIRFVI